MSFSHPQALWLALTLPAIVFLYILRPRRREKRVASTLLWQQVTQELEASRPWQRLRPNLLMWLQLLAAALLVLAAAGPSLRLAASPSNTIVLLDASASMQATDVAPNRFARACQEVEALAAGLHGGARLTVIAFDRQPRIVVQNATTQTAVREALVDLKPSSSTGNLASALSLAQALMRRMSDPRLVLVSDGGLSLEGEVPATLEFIPVGQSPANVSLAGVSLRPLGDRQAAQVTVVNHGDRAASGNVKLSVNSRTLSAQRWQLQPGAAAHLLWPEVPAQANVAAELEVDDPESDYLELDNRAWAAPKGDRKTKTLLVTKGNLFLERALAFVPGLEVYRATPEEYRLLKAASYPYELTVLDGHADGAPPPGAVLLVNPPSGVRLAGMTTASAFKPAGLTADPASPLLRYVDLRDLVVAQARQLVLGPGWAADITMGGFPLLAHGEIEGRRQAVLAFDLHAANLPLRPAFPVLVQNLVSWLMPPSLEVPGAARVGEEIKVAALPLAERVVIAGPGSSRTELAPPFPPAPYVPSQPGLYRLIQSWGDTEVEEVFAVNAYDPREAALAPRAPSQERAGEAPFRQAQAPVRPLPLTRGLALAALVVALCEWGVASRGR